jgi:ribosomal protein S6
MEEETIKKQYTLHFILDSSVNSGGADACRAKINEKIEARGGKIEASICQDASRRFAYPINKQNAGFFCESVFSVFPESIKTLSDDLKSEHQIIRYMVEFKKPMKFRAKPTRGERYKSAIQGEATRLVVPARQASEAPYDSGSHKREKVSMEEIDKKLDEIIKNI